MDVNNLVTKPFPFLRLHKFWVVILIDTPFLSLKGGIFELPWQTLYTMCCEIFAFITFILALSRALSVTLSKIILIVCGWRSYLRPFLRTWKPLYPKNPTRSWFQYLVTHFEPYDTFVGKPITNREPFFFSSFEL